MLAKQVLFQLSYSPKKTQVSGLHTSVRRVLQTQMPGSPGDRADLSRCVGERPPAFSSRQDPGDGFQF
jgi:hypothetical protein